MKQICLIILFLFKITYILTAQSYSEFKKIEGPYSNVVYSIMQDTKGFIWIATEAGVIRYDGNKLINFTVDEGLTSNDVFQIFEDKKNRIWFLTYDGKPCFYLNGKISNGINTNWLRRISPKKFATYFHQIDENEFWYVTLDSAYHFINDKLVNNLGRYNQDAFNNIQAVHKYKDSTYIIENMGVYNTTSKKMNLFKNDFIIYPNYTKVYCYEDKIFYFISNKLICYSITSRSSKLIYQTRITNNHLVFIPTRKKHEVICSLKDSLYTLDMTKEEVKDFKYLNINYISNYLKDFENNIWISSLESGLLISYKQQDKNIHKISIPKAEQNYYATTINKLDNKIYIGVEGGKYVLINGSKNELKRVSSKANSNSKVLQFFSFNNNLFILSENRLIIKKRLKGEILEIEYPFKQAVEVKDYLYFVTSLGIYRIAKKNVEGLTNLNFIKLFERINTERFSCILALSEDSLLVGGTRGLQLLKNDKIDSSFLSSFEIKKGFISKIIKHKNGDIIFATRNFGIGIINNKNIFTINKSDGLLSNNCNSLYVSENGDLWVATAKGINKIKYNIRPNQKIRTYIEAVLSKHTESTGYINDLAIYSDSLIFATRTGAFIHSLSKKITQTYTPPIHIESLIVKDSLRLFKPSFNFTYSENNIKINFTGISFNPNNYLSYRYKLLPVDSNWHYTNNTFVEYPYLENGSYIFQVSAKVENGKYNANTADIKFQISPPFYKKTWFIILSITILITLIVWAATFKLKIQKQKLELANANLILDNEKILYEKNLIELEQKALSLQMNPHFIFNAMNAIKGFYSSNDKESANEYIDKFSFLMRMILEKSNEEKISLNDELLITELYLQLALLRFDKKFNYYITVDQKINKNGILIPPMITQPFIENSVIHGIAPLSKIGKIEINYHIDSNYLICKIKDNGIGINESIKIKNKHFHTSKGISITKQRLMNLYINKGDQIKPISIESDASIGTTVTLTIPLK